MDIFLFKRNDYERLYNCSLYNVTDVPLEKRQSILLGTFFTTCFIVFELLYIPCLVAISRRMDQSCYKLMFYIGLTDVACLWIPGFLTGYFATSGAVFCSHPTLIYLAGVLGTFLWVAESTADVLLAFSRCVEMTSPHLGKTLFDGNRAWLWMVPPTVYALCFVTFTKPVLFSGIYVSWFFNPHVGYVDDVDGVYHNNLHFFHNSFICCGIIVTYGLFGVILFAKSTRYDKRSSSQKTTFIQVFLISMVNASASSLYIYMQFVRLSEFLIVLGQFLWMSAHGLPAIIYLLMNDTIRRDCKNMLLNVKKIASIHPLNKPDVCAAQPETVNGEVAGSLRV